MIMSQIRIDTGELLTKNVVSFFRMTTQGGSMLLISIAAGVIGLLINQPMLYFPGLIIPLSFLLFVLRYRTKKLDAITIKVNLPQLQVKAKTFLSMSLDISSESDVFGMVTVETSNGLFPIVSPPSKLIALSADTENTYSFLFLAAKRGKEEIKRVTIEYYGLLGFFSLIKRFVLKKSIVVLPEPQRIQLPWTLKQKILDRLISQISIPVRGRGTDFLALRDFQFGDEIRNISWKATAKFNKIISKEFEEPRQLRFLLVADNSLFMGGPKLEFALSAVEELVTVIRRTEHSVHILVHGNKTYKRIKLGTSPGVIRTLGITLHNVVPEGSGFNYDTLFTTITQHKLTDTVVILLSDLELEPETVQQGIAKIRPYVQKFFFLSCYTPGFGVLALKNSRDQAIYTVDQLLYRREIIEPKITREYNRRIAQYHNLIHATNSIFHLIESYETNILLEVQHILNREQGNIKKSRNQVVI